MQAIGAPRGQIGQLRNLGQPKRRGQIGPAEDIHPVPLQYSMRFIQSLTPTVPRAVRLAIGQRDPPGLKKRIHRLGGQQRAEPQAIHLGALQKCFIGLAAPAQRQPEPPGYVLVRNPPPPRVRSAIGLGMIGLYLLDETGRFGFFQLGPFQQAIGQNAQRRPLVRRSWARLLRTRRARASNRSPSLMRMPHGDHRPDEPGVVVVAREGGDVRLGQLRVDGEVCFGVIGFAARGRVLHGHQDPPLGLFGLRLGQGHLAQPPGPVGQLHAAAGDLRVGSLEQKPAAIWPLKLSQSYVVW